MTKQFFLLITAAAAMQLSAGAGIASDAAAPDAVQTISSHDRESVLALFMSALLEKSPEKQCVKLLEVVEKDLRNAESPLQAFRTSFKKLQKRQEILDKFNALWKKYPSDPLLIVHGAAINSACGVPPKELLSRLRGIMMPLKLVNSVVWDPASTVVLLSHGAAAMLDAGEYEQLAALFKAWQKVPAPHNIAACTILAEACYTGAARAWAAGKKSCGDALDQCFREAVVSIKKADKNVSNRRVAENILYFYLKFRKILPGEAIRFVREYDGRVRSSESNLWRLTAAVECGSAEDFEKAAALVAEMNPRFDAAELRFKFLLNARKFAEAQKVIKHLPSKHHFDLMTQLYVAQKAWDDLYKLIDQALRAGTPPDLRIGHMLLVIAEKKRDHAIFRMGEKILAPSASNPVVANSIGYLSAVLEIDLPRARKLLSFALSREPQSMAYLDSMAWIAFKQKKYAEAEKFINAALLQIVPSEGIAVVLEHAGDIAAARKKSPLYFYKLSLKYAPFDSEFDKENVIRKMKAFK